MQLYYLGTPRPRGDRHVVLLRPAVQRHPEIIDQMLTINDNYRDDIIIMIYTRVQLVIR